MTIVHHLGQLSQDPENLSKGQKAWGKSLPESLGAIQQRILHDQTPSDNMATPPAWGKSPSKSPGALDDQTKIFWGMAKYFQQGQLPTF